MTDLARARSFDAWADEYDRFRPNYPDALFDAIADGLHLPPGPVVVDLGAGTGRASLAMAARGWRVTAVEPGRPMLDILRAAAADRGLVVATLQASAEETGLTPGTVDLVTAAQAFHWFDSERAVGEIVRILRPGGGVALFWNVRHTERSPFLAEYAALLERTVGDDEGPRYQRAGRRLTERALRASGDLEEVELLAMEQEIAMTPGQFVGMVFTASYIRTGLDAERQARFRDELEQILVRHGHFDEQPFKVPYRIDLWIARKRDR